MYKVQVIHLQGSIFIELCGEKSQENAEKEAEKIYTGMVEKKVHPLWVGLWEGDKVIDTFDGTSWGRTVLFC